MPSPVNLTQTGEAPTCTCLQWSPFPQGATGPAPAHFLSCQHLPLHSHRACLECHLLSGWCVRQARAGCSTPVSAVYILQMHTCIWLEVMGQGILLLGTPTHMCAYMHAGSHTCSCHIGAPYSAVLCQTRVTVDAAFGTDTCVTHMTPSS